INVLRVGISETAQTTRSSSPPPSLPPLALPSADPETSAPPRIDFARPITPPMFWQHMNPTPERERDPSFQERLDEALHALRSSPALADVEAFLSGTEQERRHQPQDWPSYDDTSSREARTRTSSLVSDWVNRDRDYDSRRAPRLSTNAGQLSPFRLDFDVDDTNSTRWAQTAFNPSDNVDASDPPRSRPLITQPHVPPPLPPMATGHRHRHRRPPPASSSNSLVSENAAALRRDIARLEILQSMNATANSQPTPEASDDTSGFLFLPYHADSTRSLRRPPHRTTPPSESTWSSSTFVSSAQRDRRDQPREALSAGLHRSHSTQSTFTQAYDYHSNRTQEILRLRAQVEDERRAFNISPPIPISPGLNHLMPDDSIRSTVPPSLPSPDLGPVLSPILDIDNDPVYDISRPTPSPPSRPATNIIRGTPPQRRVPPQPEFEFLPPASQSLSTLNDTRAGQHSDFGDLIDELSRRRPAFRAINPDDYRPGIFRNTLQRYAELDRLQNPPPQSSPPSLPPLGFEWERESSQGNARSQLSHDAATRPAADGPTQHPISVPAEDEYLWRFPGLNSTRNDESSVLSGYTSAAWAATQRRRPPPVAIPDRHLHPSAVPDILDHAPPHQRHARSSSDVHEHLSRRPRIEGARILPSQVQYSQRDYPTSTRGAEEGLSLAIEVMQHDGLSVSRSHQLMRQYQREREAERARARANASTTTRAPNSSFGEYVSSDAEDIPPRASYRSRPMARRHEWYAVDLLDFSSPQNSDANAGSNGPTPSAHSARMRAARSRIPANHTMGFMFGPSGVHDFNSRVHRRGRPSGDYMRDEDFDTSYEGLLSLAATLGDAKPKSTPEHIIAGLPTGIYKDWATPDSDHRCPICLDDYEPSDPVLKLPACNHWLHKACLEQWLRGANTCPVCRNTVKTSRTPAREYHQHGHTRTGSEPDAGTSRTVDRDRPSALAALRGRRAWVMVNSGNQRPDTEPLNIQHRTATTRQREGLRIVPHRREPPPLLAITPPGTAADSGTGVINIWDTYRSPMASSRNRQPPSWSSFDRTREGPQRNANRGSESPPQPRGPRPRFGNRDDEDPSTWH
ncbi:RING-type E3 ubiquitin transferase, partial [Pleurotus pulmonarius]